MLNKLPLKIMKKRMSFFKKLFFGFLSLCLLFVVSFAHAEDEPRVFQVPDELFEELQVKDDTQSIQQGADYWPHDVHVNVPAFALQYGRGYTVAGGMKRWKNYKLHLAVPIDFILKYKRELRQSGVTPILFPYNHIMEVQGVPLAPRNRGEEQHAWWPFVLDPRTEENYLRGIEQDLREYKGYFFGVQNSDEAMDSVTNQLLYLYSQYRDTGRYPFIDECNVEVKNNFGFGKFGIPKCRLDDYLQLEDPDDPNRFFQFIAYKRWLVERMMLQASKVYKCVKSKDSNILVFSYVDQSGLSPFRFSRWADNFDIILNQAADVRPKSYIAKFGFITKAVSDLTGKPVNITAHVHNQMMENPPNFNAEETRELLSQIIRNGGTGFHVFLPDRGIRNPPYCFQSDYYGAPERWWTEMRAVDTLSNMKKLNFPEADCAILFSEDAEQARALLWGSSPAYLFAYMFLGPYSRSWFKFIDDDQIEDGKVDLSKFKVIYMPSAKYEREVVINRLIEYVQNGGTLICTDQQAWSYFDNGKQDISKRNLLFGIKNPQNSRGNYDRVKFLESPILGKEYVDLPIPAKISNMVITPNNADGMQVVATYPGGEIAAIMKNYGNGKAVFFGFNPFQEDLVKETSWQNFFRDLQIGLGVKTGQDIWRFKLPPPTAAKIYPKRGECLTGNYIFWTMGVPKKGDNNIDTQGNYAIIPAPDNIPDLSLGKILLLRGKLTNRGPRYNEESKQWENVFYQNLTDNTIDLNQYLLKWSENKTDEIQIVFDFKKSYKNVDSVMIYYAGLIPKATVFVRNNINEGWLEVGSNAENIETDPNEAVRLCKIIFEPVECRYVKVVIAKRRAGKSLILSEAEVWRNSIAIPAPDIKDEGKTTLNRDRLVVSIENPDPRILEYQYKITQDEKDGKFIRGWTVVDNSVLEGDRLNILISGLKLKTGKTYFVAVKGENEEGIFSYTAFTDGITVVEP